MAAHHEEAMRAEMLDDLEGLFRWRRRGDGLIPHLGVGHLALAVGALLRSHMDESTRPPGAPDGAQGSASLAGDLGPIRRS